MGRKFFAIIGLFFVLAAIGPSIYAFIEQKLSPSTYHFEDYESYLGLGTVDIEGAESDFVQLISIGSPLSEVNVFFESIGGHCFEIVESKHKYYCSYSHAIPFGLLVSRNWSAVIDVDERARVINSVRLNSTLEGP